MEVYDLYFKLANHNLPFKRIVSINAMDSMSEFGLLDIANLHLSNVGVQAGVQMYDEFGEMTSKIIPMRLDRVSVWQYVKKWNGYVAITNLIEPVPMSNNLKVIVYLRRNK